MNNLMKTKQAGIRREKRTVIKKLDDLGQRQVTFSKRRVGVFRKASELCALTGAECAIVCESYGGRVYAFGHPSVESVVDKYLGENTCSELPADNNSESPVNSLCMHDKLKEQYSKIMEELETEKKKSLPVKREKEDIVNKERDDLFWWEQPFEHLEVEDLEDFISSMEKLRNKLESRADDLKVLKTSSCPAPMLNANNNTVNSNDSGLSDESSENKNVITENVGLMQDLLMNNNLNFDDDDLLNEILAMKDPKFDDDGLDDLVNDFYLQNNSMSTDTGNKVQLSHVDANHADLQNFDADLQNFDADLQNIDYDALPSEFSCLFPLVS